MKIFTTLKIVAFMAKKNDATAVLRAIIAWYFAPAGLTIGVIRTDNGGEFQAGLSHSSPSWASNTSAPRRIHPGTMG